MRYMPYEVIQEVFTVLGYHPSPEQEAVHRALLQLGGSVSLPQPNLVVVGGGLQSGKSFGVAHHVLGRWLVDGLTWLVGRRYADAKREYGYIRDLAVANGFAEAKDCSYADEGPWEMRFGNGHIVKVLSSDDTTRLSSEAPDGIALCEPGRQTRDAFETAWERVVPQSGYLLLAGTFERASGWYRSLWRECQGPNEFNGVALSLPSYANRRFYPQGQQDPKFQAELLRAKNDPVGWDRFQERFLGIPRVPHDMVLREFVRGVHVRKDAEYTPDFDVILGVDPGYNPSAYAVIFCQVVQGQVRVFDELYMHETIGRDVITLVEQHWAFSSVKRVVVDPYGGAQHAMAQESPIETWTGRLASRGIAVMKSDRRSLADRDGRLHDYLHLNPVLGQPGIIIHPRAKNLIQELEGWVDDDGNERGYRFRVGSDGQIRSDTPLDRDNHAVSALGYLLIDQFRYSDARYLLPKPRVSLSALDRAYLARQRAYAGRR